jgi:hypothetical protein
MMTIVITPKYHQIGSLLDPIGNGACCVGQNVVCMEKKLKKIMKLLIFISKKKEKKGCIHMMW